MAVTPQATRHPAETTHQAIVFEDVSIQFEDNPVLDGVSFALKRGETKILLGIAGAGKSTILKMTLGLVKPDRGRIVTLGYEVSSMREEELFDLRRKVGMVFQESALFDSLTVEENVAYRLQEEEDLPAEEVRQRVVDSLRFVELEQTLALFPAELSGGMRRRVAIARAIISQPEVLLYDSPTAGLDPITAHTIIALLIKERDISHTTTLVVTTRYQDGNLIANFRYNSEQGSLEPAHIGAGRHARTTFMVLREGRLVFEGDQDVLEASTDPYISKFVKHRV